MNSSGICIGSLKGCYQKAIDEDDEKTILDLEPNLRHMYDDEEEENHHNNYDDWDEEEEEEEDD